METEFVLSEKIEEACWVIEGSVIRKQDVKEFIKKLKEEIDNAQEDCGNLDWISKEQALNIINKLAGSDLI